MKLTKFEGRLSDLLAAATKKLGEKGHATKAQLATSLTIEAQHLVPPPVAGRTADLDSETISALKDVDTLAGLRQVFGEMPVENGASYLVVIDEDGDGFSVEPAKGHTALILETGRLLDGYAQHHLAKSPPDIDKAARNVRQAAKLYESIGIAYNPPGIPTQTPQEAARSAQEADRLPGTGERPLRGSDAPLDRQELLDWFDMKLDGCAKHGMREAADILQAFRGEVAQHLEAAPIDFAVALNAFYDDCHAHNVKAGWWTDLATGQPKARSVGELFILFVTELAEAYEAYLTGEMDNKLTDMPGLGVELGDLQIRFADFAGALRAGKIVAYAGDGVVHNAGDRMFREIVEIANRYEAIRKTDEAKGDPEPGAPIDPQDVGAMVVAKLDFNATRADRKIENRLKDDGKRT